MMVLIHNSDGQIVFRKTILGDDENLIVKIKKLMEDVTVEREFKCMHFDGSGCMCTEEGCHHDECSQDFDCSDYGED